VTKPQPNKIGQLELSKLPPAASKSPPHPRLEKPTAKCQNVNKIPLIFEKFSSFLLTGKGVIWYKRK
jgi:hypothetical protein